MKSDFIFRETAAGALELRGDFDGVYGAQADPWDQAGMSGPMAGYYARSRTRLGQSLRANQLVGRGARLEVGCGHGHALAQLDRISDVEGSWHGVDISERAIAAARQNYPHYCFHVADITQGTTLDSLKGHCDVVILNQVLWYVLERMDVTVKNCCALLRLGGLLYISQAFLRGKQRYGAEIADGFHGVLALFMRRYPFLRLVELRYDDSDSLVHNDGLLVFRRVMQ